MATESIGTGLDQPDVATWEAATDNDLVTAAEGEIGEMESGHAEGADVTIKGATTDATYFRTLRMQSGFSTRGRLDGLDIEEANFVLEDAHADFQDAQFGTGVNDVRIRRTLFDGNAGTHTHGCNVENGSGWLLEACIARDYDQSGFRSHEDITLKNCTAQNCVIGGSNFRGGFDCEAGTMTLYSCASFDHDQSGTSEKSYRKGGGGTMAGDYNWGDTSGDDRPGANGGDTLTSADFEDAANDDFHIPDTSSDLYQGGDPSNSAATDFDGVSFDGTNPAAGAFEFVSGGAPASPPTLTLLGVGT